ncbi:vacuolar protein sorting-associated protein 16 homolog [Geospiza fortis]|uniref:Vacuolar protein sorting-associated protein 16 homolog n=1 Tax=Geospiza fortis TaxID=48883 RepID=A0A8N5F089_GEOFO|nr:vacuolar protein sorting-associated protein 16 homolog [Geospiza fortis]
MAEGSQGKPELYSMEWGLREDLRDCVVAAAPYGGPIALLRNSRRDKAPSARPLLEIYSASGLLLASVPWKSGHLVHLGWTAGEDLLCIQEDGTVLVYNLFCEFKRHFSMGNEVLQNHVLEAQVFHTEFGTGVAILTGALRFSLATNIDDLKLRRLPEVPGLQKAPLCWTVLAQDRVTMVLLAMGQELFLLDNTSCSVLVRTVPDPSPLLQEKFCEFNTGIRSPPKQMVWCTRPRSRQRAVVLAWERQLMVVGNSSECIRYPLGTGDTPEALPPPLAPTLRIFSQSHRMLPDLSEASQEIFRIASMAPGALLLEAQKEYEKESQKADEYLREIREQQLLPEAVGQCIEAAGYEHEPDTQKSLLRAASFGKCFLDKFPPEGFVRMCQDLRVLNAIRDYQIGIPLTFTQYKQLTIEVLLDSTWRIKGVPVPIPCPCPCPRVPHSLSLSPVYTVVLHLKNELNRGSFFMTLQNQPVALSLYRQVSAPKRGHQELGNLHVLGDHCQKRIEGRVAALQNALDEFYKAKNDFAAKATEEQIKLLRLQLHLQEELDKPYLDLSLHDTVATLILDGHHKRAEQLYRDFRIPDKRYWWLKINALATRGDWEEMEKFSKSKKSPIGYLPFVEVAVKHHNRYEAKKYAPRVPPEQRVKAFVLVGDLEQAAEAAVERKNEAEMSLVLSRCSPGTDGALAERLNRARAQLLKK